MSCVHYKFSSKLNYDTVTFDGLHITLCDLKKQIMGRERLKASDCDLQITNAQTKEEYTDDGALIPKNSSVIIRRIPIGGVKATSKTYVMMCCVHFFQFECMECRILSPNLCIKKLPVEQTANLAEANASEDDKIRAMMSQSNHEYDPVHYMKKLLGPPPPNYTCFRCMKTGHYIRNCPTNGDKNFESTPRMKKSTGIPRSFMMEVDDPNMKGAMLTNTGKYAIPTIDAVFDINCIRTFLLESDEHMCPTCNQTDVSPDCLIANKFLRQAVNNFKNETGYTKRLRKGQAPQTAPMQGQSRPQVQRPVQLAARPTSSRQQDPLMANIPPPVAAPSPVVPAAIPTPVLHQTQTPAPVPPAAPTVQVNLVSRGPLEVSTLVPSPQPQVKHEEPVSVKEPEKIVSTPATSVMVSAATSITTYSVPKVPVLGQPHSVGHSIPTTGQPMRTSTVHPGASRQGWDA
ncbi:UNVERIFIED_CONTAM: hypothetical protein FKN15_004147 [Acipenser sinensis]